MTLDLRADGGRRSDDRRVLGHGDLERLREVERHRAELAPQADKAFVPGAIRRRRDLHRLGIGLGDVDVTTAPDQSRAGRVAVPGREVGIDDQPQAELFKKLHCFDGSFREDRDLIEIHILVKLMKSVLTASPPPSLTSIATCPR